MRHRETIRIQNKYLYIVKKATIRFVIKTSYPI